MYQESKRKDLAGVLKVTISYCCVCASTWVCCPTKTAQSGGELITLRKLRQSGKANGGWSE